MHRVGDVTRSRVVSVLRVATSDDSIRGGGGDRFAVGGDEGFEAGAAAAPPVLGETPPRVGAAAPAPIDRTFFPHHLRYAFMLFTYLINCGTCFGAVYIFYRDLKYTHRYIVQCTVHVHVGCVK